MATVIVYLALAALAIKATVESENTKTALCALRSDLETRVAESKTFLKEHPKGIPGVPVATLRVSISNGEHTINALGVVNC